MSKSTEQIWRLRYVIVAFALLGGILGAAAGQLTPARYLSTALMLASPLEQSILGFSPATPGLSTELVVLDTQVQLMTSPAHIRSVAETLSESDDTDELLSLVASDLVLSELYARSPQTALEEFVRKGLTVVQDGRTNMISVRFVSQSPTVSALVANTVETTFLADQTAARREETNRIRSQIAARVEALEADAREAAKRVATFKAENGLLVPMEFEQRNLSDLTRTLAEAERDLDQLEGQLSQLRAQTAGDRAGAAETRVPDDANGGSAELAFSRDIERVASDFEERRDAAVEQVAALRDAVQQQRQKVRAQSDALVELDILARNAKSAAEIYTQMLDRWHQVSEEVFFIKPDAQHVSAATPSRVPVTPGIILLAVMGFISFAILGVVFTLFVGAARPTRRRRRWPGI